MSRRTRLGGVAVWALALCASTSQAQSGSDVYWHIDPNVQTCSMVIDPSLTQDQWHRFTQQVGAIASFKSLAPARTLGRKRFRVAVDAGSTPVDQHDLAWINTFTHPDAECPLGDAIRYPALRARYGVSDRMDVGAYWTTAPSANYGMAGGEVTYAFLQDSGKSPAAAVRASFTILTGVPDFSMGIYSLDALASKDVQKLTPYAGIRTSLAIGTETTAKVDLRGERVAIAQGFFGATYSLWVFDLAAEYDVSTVNTFALAVGYGF